MSKQSSEPSDTSAATLPATGFVRQSQLIPHIA